MQTQFPIYRGVGAAKIDTVRARREPRRAIPVRVPRGIVAILVSQASIGTIVQVAKAPGAAYSRRVRAIEDGHLAPAYPALGACSPSGRLRPSIHPAFSRCRKAEESHASSRPQGNSSHPRKPGQHRHHRSGRQSARGSALPQSPRHRRRT